MNSIQMLAVSSFFGMRKTSHEAKRGIHRALLPPTSFHLETLDFYW